MKSKITRLVALIFSCVFLLVHFLWLALLLIGQRLFRIRKYGPRLKETVNFIVEFDINATHRMDQLGG